MTFVIHLKGFLSRLKRVFFVLNEMGIYLKGDFLLISVDSNLFGSYFVV